MPRTTSDLGVTFFAKGVGLPAGVTGVGVSGVDFDFLVVLPGANRGLFSDRSLVSVFCGDVWWVGFAFDWEGYLAVSGNDSIVGVWFRVAVNDIVFEEVLDFLGVLAAGCNAGAD